MHTITYRLKLTFIIMTLLLCIPFQAFATVEVESKEEMLGYIRVLFSDQKVMDKYNALVSDGYEWVNEHGNFGSMGDKKLELFPGQVQIHMRKIQKSSGSIQKESYKHLIIDFTWSRKLKKITGIDNVDIY